MKKQNLYVGAVMLLGVSMLVLFQAPTLDQPLIESYGFRQTQTAYQTRTHFSGEGTLLHPVLPVFGAPWQVPFEFPVFQMSAAFLMHLFDIPSDVASRTASLVWSILALVPLWGVCRRYLTVTGSLAATAVFSASPLSLLYSRASLIEYCAVFFCLTFAYFSLRLVDTQSIISYVGAATSAALSAMVKITTFLPVLVFVLVLLPLRKDIFAEFRSRRRRRAVLIVSPTLVGLISGMWWTQHADSIKASSEATAWLTSSRLREWNFGTLSQRLHTENYRVLIEDGIKLFGPFTFGALVLSVPIVFFSVNYSKLLLASLLAYATGVFVFINLYLVHEYYFVAVIPYVAIGVGGFIQHLTAGIHKKQIRNVMAVLMTVGVTGSAIHFSKSWWGVSRQDFEYDRSLARVIPESSYALVADSDWNPELLYAINRRGLMLRPGAFNIDYVRNLPDLELYDFLVGQVDDFAYLTIRKFFSPVAPDVFKINEQSLTFEPEGLYATYEALPSEIVTESLKLRCGEESKLSLSALTAPYGLYVTAAEEANIVFDSFATAVPANQLFIRVTKRVDDGTISCTNGDSVSVEILKSEYLS
jgi:hypothetical protein